MTPIFVFISSKSSWVTVVSYISSTIFLIFVPNSSKEISKFVHRLIGKPLEESMNFNSMNSNAEEL